MQTLNSKQAFVLHVLYLGIAVFLSCSRSLSFIVTMLNVALAMELKTSQVGGLTPVSLPQVWEEKQGEGGASFQKTAASL